MAPRQVASNETLAAIERAKNVRRCSSTVPAASNRRPIDAMPRAASVETKIQKSRNMSPIQMNAGQARSRRSSG
jgi:hypothetical protein